MRMVDDFITPLGSLLVNYLRSYLKTLYEDSIIGRSSRIQ